MIALEKISVDILIIIINKKKLDVSGIEPEAFRMQIERDTTTPYTLSTLLKFYSSNYLNNKQIKIKKKLLIIFTKK